MVQLLVLWAKRNDRYIRGGKTYLSENGINCPMIVHVPGAKKDVLVTLLLILLISDLLY